MIEKRWLNDYKLPKTEVRAGDGGSKRIIGHAAVFNRNSQNLGGFVEQVAPGAFAKTIQEADVRGLINHDTNILLGRNKNDTLTLIEDNTGLAYDIEPPDTTIARDWVISLERGDISQSSFSFRVIEVEWGLTPEEFPLRTLREVALYDVGPVTFPAYLDADSGVRNHAALADLAERRSMKLETVIELAQHNELRDLIKDGVDKRTDDKPDPKRERITLVDPDKKDKRSEARDEHEARSIEPVPGSWEELRSHLYDAVDTWAKVYTAERSNSSYSWWWISIDATFDSRVVATCYGSAFTSGGDSYRWDYTRSEDGDIELGEPETVTLTLTVVSGDGENSLDTGEKRTTKISMDDDKDEPAKPTRNLSIARHRLDLLQKQI